MKSGKKFVAAVALTTPLLLATVGGAAYYCFGQNDRLLEFLTDTYGIYDADKKLWLNSEAGRQYSICAENAVDVQGEGHMLVAVCGASREMDSHATAGSIDLYVLKEDRRSFTVAAQADQIESGGFGQPGDVNVMQLGPSFYGFAISEGWSGQGLTLGTLRLFVPNGAVLQEALEMRSSLDNTGTRMCSEEHSGCRTLERKLTVDTSPGDGRVYPLIITQSGRSDGHNFSGRFKLTFDKKRRIYVAPKGLELMPE